MVRAREHEGARRHTITASLEGAGLGAEAILGTGAAITVLVPMSGVDAATRALHRRFFPAPVEQAAS